MHSLSSLLPVPLALFVLFATQSSLLLPHTTTNTPYVTLAHASCTHYPSTLTALDPFDRLLNKINDIEAELESIEVSLPDQSYSLSLSPLFASPVFSASIASINSADTDEERKQENEVEGQEEQGGEEGPGEEAHHGKKHHRGIAHKARHAAKKVGAHSVYAAKKAKRLAHKHASHALHLLSRGKMGQRKQEFEETHPKPVHPHRKHQQEAETEAEE